MLKRTIINSLNRVNSLNITWFLDGFPNPYSITTIRCWVQIVYKLLKFNIWILENSLSKSMEHSFFLYSSNLYFFKRMECACSRMRGEIFSLWPRFLNRSFYIVPAFSVSFQLSCLVLTREVYKAIQGLATNLLILPLYCMFPVYFCT